VANGKTIKINQFVSTAFFKFNFNRQIKAVVKPHPGHSIPKIDFQRHGIQISIPNVACRIVENKK
jgi:hypothetical protein